MTWTATRDWRFGEQVEARTATSRTSGQQSCGTSAGVNVAPGPDDDGWDEPPPVPLRDGSLVQLYKDGQALRAAYAAIARATRRVRVEVYIFHADETGRAFAELLAKRARDGLDVRVIYDSVGSIDADRRMLAEMRRAGVRLREFHPWKPWCCEHSWRVFNRDHRKLVVADDDVAVLGGQNLGNEYGSSWVIGMPHGDCWRDTGVGVRGSASRMLAEAFERTWRYLEHGGPIDRTELITIEIDQSRHANSTMDIAADSLAVLASVPSPRSRLLPSLARLLSEATESIELTMAYFAPPLPLVEQLFRSARSGVRVRLMLPERSDVRLLVVAARAFYDTLMSAGVEIYERQRAVLHAKSLCVDGRIGIVGSTNLDYRSIQYNCELSALIHSRAFGAQMHRLFEHDVCFARRIAPDEWRHRPLRDRLVQWIVMRARYLL